MSIDKDLVKLGDLSSANAKERGSKICADVEASALLEILWIRHLQKTSQTTFANCLLAGAESGIREAVGCLVLGLSRPALNSLRMQIDLVMSWLYFKDHPVEWQMIQETGENFKLKGEIFKYLRDWFPRFSDRWGVLVDIRTRTSPDPYRLLSAHMHGQNEPAIPIIIKPLDVIGTQKSQDEVIAIQGECSEFINDLFWAILADSWRSVPRELTDRLNARFKTDAQRATFFRH